MTFRGHLNDGSSSRNHPCLVELGADRLLIEITEGPQQGKRAECPIHAIHPIPLKGSHQSLRYGAAPEQVLSLEKPSDLEALIAHYPRADFYRSSYNRFQDLGWKGLIASLAGIIVLSVVFLLYVAPALADAFAQRIPMEYEVYLGKKVYASYLSYFEVDEEASETLQSFLDELDYSENYELEVVVVDYEMMNAFALPGGNMVVFSGIIEQMESAEELAALLAHESVHVEERHSLRTLSRNLSTYLLLSILTGDVGGFSSVIIENSSTISDLSYSRSLEKEADLKGLELMVANELNPEGMVTLFRRFEELNDSVNAEMLRLAGLDSLSSTPAESAPDEPAFLSWEKLQDLLSTHPSPKNRMGYLAQHIKKMAPLERAKNPKLEALFTELKQELKP